MTERELLIRVADAKVGQAGDVLVTIGLGSCVAIVLYDDAARVGGLAHILLPSPSLSRRDLNKAKFPQTAVPLLLEQLTALGGQSRRITARLAGGANMFANLAPPGTINMGERNLVATRSVLGELRIPIAAEAVGGDFGRTVRFFPADGRVEIHAVRRDVIHL